MHLSILYVFNINFKLFDCLIEAHSDKYVEMKSNPILVENDWHSVTDCQPCKTTSGLSDGPRIKSLLLVSRYIRDLGGKNGPGCTAKPLD